MDIKNRVVATRNIKLIDGTVYTVGTKGVITMTPADKSVLHVLFEGAKDPCAVMTAHLRLENSKPTLLEKLRLLFQ